MKTLVTFFLAFSLISIKSDYRVPADWIVT